MSPWAEVVADLTAKYTLKYNDFKPDSHKMREAKCTVVYLYSTMSPVLVLGGSQLRWAPSVDFEILIADGAPGKPGRHVLKAEISDQAPRPQALMPATRNL